ncbi:MAG TPA: dihydrolipoamide acetyltransferase family protein [Streptosporangiaceae bacterium]|nr:dihydrolipoamide acetyltransferase family protein [Streptosporangiaceae bacterium]
MAEFRMPSLGADMDEGTLLEWLVKPGDQVHKGDIVAVVDTAKAAVEVECFDSGVVSALLLEPGQRVPVGTPLAVIAPAGAVVAAPAAAPADRRRDRAKRSAPAAKRRAPAAGEPLPEPPAGPPPAGPPPAGPPPAKPPPARRPAVLSPLVRQLAGQKGVDLRQVRGTGPAGAVTRTDVESAAARGQRLRVSPFARRIAAELGTDLTTVRGTGVNGAIRAEDVRRAAGTNALPQAPPGGDGATAAGRLAGQPAQPPGRQGARPEAAPARQAAMRRAIANLMARSKREIPHYYLSTTIDLEQATQWLRRRNREMPVPARIVPAALLLKAAAVAAREVPQLNGFWVDDHFVPSERVHLGVAISLRGGGMVAPAIHDADRRTVADLMAQLRDLATRAREGRLRGSEMTDSTITVTNLGDRGVESVFGVIYPPQVALAGFGKVTKMPCAVGGLLGVRPQVTATLAADHRATDGYTGARYLEAAARLLQRPEEL